MATYSKAVKISQKHLLGIQDLSIQDINLILDEASKFIDLNKTWDKQKKFTDKWVGIRLICDNKQNNLLN